MRGRPAWESMKRMKQIATEIHIDASAGQVGSVLPTSSDLQIGIHLSLQSKVSGGLAHG